MGRDFQQYGLKIDDPKGFGCYYEANSTVRQA